MLFVLLWACAGVSTFAPSPGPIETKETFFARGRAAVERNAAIQPDRRRAKNVILFIGDGMDVSTITAARIYEGQKKGMPGGGEENELSFESFPHLAHSKTYRANQQVPDSAPTTTSIVTGSKTNEGFLSIAPNVVGPDFAAAARPENRLRTILESAEERGMWTGVVTTTRVTHATPAACYAHTPARDAEDDTDLAAISRSAAESGFPDIALQLFDFRVKPTRMNGRASPGLEVARRRDDGAERDLFRDDPSPRLGLKEAAMLELRPGCECCDRDLPPDSADARICSFECTFCVDCARKLHGLCPNCGGELAHRPIRPAEKLARSPASTKRVFKPEGCGKV